MKTQGLGLEAPAGKAPLGSQRRGAVLALRGWRLARPALLRHRKLVVLAVQIALVGFSYYGSFVLRLDLQFDRVPNSIVFKTLPLVIALRLVALLLFRLDRGLWRYVSTFDLVQLVKATTLSTLAFVALEVPFFGLREFPRSVFLLDWVGNLFLLSGIRLGVRFLRERFLPMRAPAAGSKRLLIIGAGDAGVALCAQALTSPSFRFRPVAFVDDDPGKIGTTIMGLPVAAACNGIPRVAQEHEVSMAVLAIPGATPARRRELVQICQQAGLALKVLPATPDILDGSVSISHIRDVDPVDLLGRPPARLDRALIKGFIQGKRVLVTGAAGSVGSELARQISAAEPGLLALIDHAENPLFLLEAELSHAFPKVPLVAAIEDITDREAVLRLLQAHRPQAVFHAAAHKHVPLMERTPLQAIRNNIGGTYVAATCAQETGVETFVLVSTDKAVRPSSVMGATKRAAEMLTHQLNGQGKTRFVCVRFGNVLGSSASVVPIFRQQIASGGPVTVTHPEASRYFMSVPEAAGLILQAGALGKGGETFVLDMGEPISIVTLAETMITLSGLTPYTDIDIVFTRLRPGEKLHEELTLESERLEPTGHEKLLVVRETGPLNGLLEKIEAFLGESRAMGSDEAKAFLEGLVPEYRPRTT